MNKKLIKTIASITCGLGIATTIPFIASSCGSSSKEDFSISYTDGASKDLGTVPAPDTVYSAGTINAGADFSFADATWYFDVTCTSDASLTAQWTEFLSISVNNDKKIQITAKTDRSETEESFSFSLYAKMGEKQTNTISGFTVTWRC